MNSLLLIDLSAVFMAAWHSTGPSEPPSAPCDRTLNRVRMISELRSDCDAVAICCDAKRNWRQDIYQPYKIQREAKPQEMWHQLRHAKDELLKRGHVLWECDGYEADDIMATAARQAWCAGIRTVVATADKDLSQLVRKADSVGPEIVIHDTRSDQIRDHDGVVAKFNVTPDQLQDYLALTGDTSDNVPGVDGVGPKKAAALIAAFGGYKGAIDAAKDETVKMHDSTRKALLAAEETLPLAFELVGLKSDAPLDIRDLEKPADTTAAPIMSAHELIESVERDMNQVFERVLSARSRNDSETETKEEKMTTTETNGVAKANGAAQPQAAPATAAKPPAPASKFSVSNVSTVAPRTTMRTIVTGKSGIGKTYFVSTIPNLFFQPIEDGLRGKSPDHNPAYFNNNGRPILPQTLAELCEAIDVFATQVNAPVDGKRPFKHYAIDGLTGIEALVHQDVCRGEKVEHMEAKEYKKLWASAEPKMAMVQRKLDAVRATGVHLWLIAHSAEAVDSASTTGEIFRRHDLLLKGSGETGVQARNLWRSWADNVFFIDWTVRVAKGDKSKRSIAKNEGRVIYTRESGTHYAKSRDRLPDALPADWNSVSAALAAGAAQPDTKLRAELDKVTAKLSDENRAIIAEEMKTANGANAIARVLSRAQGMVAIQDSENETEDSEQEEAATAAE